MLFLEVRVMENTLIQAAFRSKFIVEEHTPWLGDTIVLFWFLSGHCFK